MATTTSSDRTLALLEKFASPDQMRKVSASALARGTSSLLQELSAANEPVSITVQGSGSMVAMTDTMYRALIAALARAEHAAGFGGVLLIDRLSAQFDDLVSAMNQPGTAQTALTTLFGDPAGLNETYAPGTTEH